MKPFRFQKFVVAQRAAVFRVGTDAMLLGVLASVGNSAKILEVGTGTGVIALMLAQRNPLAKILAIDINPDAAELAAENFKNSVFSERLRSQCADFNDFTTNEKFDFIVSNPPYFEENSSQKDVFARQKILLNFHELIINAKKHLTESGTFSVIIPWDSAKNFTEICTENQLFLNRKIKIFGIENGAPKRAILEFSPSPKVLVEENFTIEKSPRIYSEEYLRLTKDFHVFRQ